MQSYYILADFTKSKLSLSLIFSLPTVNVATSGLVFGFLIAVTILVTLLSLSGYVGKANHLLDNTTHFKLQYLIAGILFFLFFSITHKVVWCFVSLFIIVINLLAVIPWYLYQPKLVVESSSKQVRLFQLNVQYNSKQYSLVIEQVRNEKPDIAVFFEITKTWANELKVLQDKYSYFFIHLEPYHIQPPLWYLEETTTDIGIAIYSKLPLEKTLTENLGGGRKTIVTQVQFQEQLFFLFASHPSFVFRTSGFELRNKQLSEIAHYVKKLNKPVIVIGDLNTTMWSAYYKDFVCQTELRNARTGFGILPSFSLVKSLATAIPLLSNPQNIFSILPSFPTDIPIDHCLVSREIGVVNARLGKKVGSDHLPLITDIAFLQRCSE